MELLTPRHGLSPRTEAALRAELRRGCLRTLLEPGSEFWDGPHTLQQIRKQDYFAGLATSANKHRLGEADGQQLEEAQLIETEWGQKWPRALVEMSKQVGSATGWHIQAARAALFIRTLVHMLAFHGPTHVAPCSILRAVRLGYDRRSA